MELVKIGEKKISHPALGVIYSFASSIVFLSACIVFLIPSLKPNKKNEE